MSCCHTNSSPAISHLAFSCPAFSSQPRPRCDKVPHDSGHGGAAQFRTVGDL